MSLSQLPQVSKVDWRTLRGVAIAMALGSGIWVVWLVRLILPDRNYEQVSSVLANLGGLFITQWVFMGIYVTGVVVVRRLRRDPSTKLE